MSSTAAVPVAPHVTPRGVPYFRLEVRTAFDSLTSQEKLYAHYFNVASWCGTMVGAAQVSYESPVALRLFFELFRANSIASLQAASGIEADEFKKFLEFVALFYSNMGNYLSFGDSKFTPACSKDSFLAVFAKAPHQLPAELLTQVSATVDALYASEAGRLELAFPPKGVTSYYGPNVSEAEAVEVDKVMAAAKIEPYNTRVWKAADGSFELRVAAKDARRVVLQEAGPRVVAVYGDYRQQMEGIYRNLELAQRHAANETQRDMITAYLKHFASGDVQDHKDSQRLWVQDKGPVVETDIGFIETYRDPRGIRAEWEGFVAVVNKKQSAAYQALVDGALDFIKALPWGPDYENAVFNKPDFTALEVLGFASSGLPSGINIPNYDEIRRDVGFKNVYLANVISAINFSDKINHVSDADWELFKTHFFVAMQVGVGIHELLGHGSGKLFMRKADGSLNFDPTTINPLTKEPVATWYEPGETWTSKFNDLANPMEECRAEAVALYLCVLPGILSVFGQNTEEDRRRTVHLVWLQMVRAGLVGLEFYSAENSQWRQAHMRARFCILQTLLQYTGGEGKEPMVRITFDAAKDFLEVTIDADRIQTEGLKAIGDLLVKLNVTKATADVARGRQFFEALTTVDEKFLEIRKTIMKLRKPRKQFVQCHTRLDAATGEVQLVEFEPTVEGAITAMVQRHTDIPLGEL